jgi:hypothetical protein
MLAAGLCSIVGLAGHVGTPGYGAFGAPAQLLALAALATTLVPRRPCPPRGGPKKI